MNNIVNNIVAEVNLHDSSSEQAWLKSCLNLLSFAPDANDSDKIGILQTVLQSLLKRQMSMVQDELSTYSTEADVV